MEVARGIHRRTRGVVNWYVVEDGGRVTLVDAGVPGDWALLMETLESLGRRLEDVEAVLLTHAHIDHTGFAERARTEARARVWVHQSDADRARGGGQPANEAGVVRYLVRLELYRTLISLARRGGTRLVPISELSTFAHGERLDVPGRPRVLHAPGHTAGSAALWFDERSALCTGDTVVTHNPLTGRDGPQIMPDGLNRDSQQALRSLAVFDGVDADTILPGHGGPWGRGVGEAVRLARVAGRS